MVDKFSDYIAENASEIVLIILLIGMILAGGVGYSMIERQTAENKKAKDLRYECYLDGENVDIDYIDLNLYNTTVDNENKRVYLTKKVK